MLYNVCANHLVGEPAFLLLRRWTLVRSLGNSLDARNVSSACFLSFCVTRTKDWQLSFSLLTSMPYICIRYYYVSIKNSCNGTQNTSVYSGTRTTSTKVDVSEKGKNNSPLKMPHYSHSLHLKIHSRFSAWSTFGYTCQTFCIPLQMPNSTLLRVDQSRSCLISRKRSWIANCQIWW